MIQGILERTLKEQQHSPLFWQVQYLAQDSWLVYSQLRQCLSLRIHAPGGCPVDGRMTGGGRLNEEIIVTHGFELHCDLNDDLNNLEINWDGGNHFHLESLTLVRCLDDPTIAPKPPNAGFDRYEAFGIGKLNGVDGAEVYFELTDAGEPGTNDTAFIVVPSGY